MSTAHSEPLAARLGARRIAMDRRRCVVTPDRVDIRPWCPTIVLVGIGLSLGLSVVAVLWQGALPFALGTLLVLAAMVLLSLSGLVFVYSAAAAHVVADRARQAVVWRQGLPGVGNQELVPFSEIHRLEVEETAPRDRRGLRRDAAQFEVTLLTTSGRRLRVGAVTVPHSAAAEGQERARLVAEAIAGIADKRVEVAKARRRPRVVRPYHLPSRR